MNNRETIYSNVKHILTHLPDTRDNNISLIEIYYKMNHNIYFWIETGILFRKLQNKQIPSFETLARFSRQIQEKNPELRGKEWLKRQRKQMKAKEDLGYKTHIAI